MKLTYEEYSLDTHFFTLKGFFFMYMPVRVPYKNVIEKAREAGFEVSDESIIEQAVMLGFGWIGVAVKTTSSTMHPSVKHVKGDFTATTYVGPYKEVGDTMKQVMADYPEATEFYSIYLNSPDDVTPEKLETMIVFR